MAQTIPDEWEPSELLSLQEVAARLRDLRKPRHPQSLYDRIRRGTLHGVQVNGRWYVPKPYVQALEREPYQPAGGRPRVTDTRVPISRKHRRLDPPDVIEAKRLARLPVGKRLRLALDAQTLQFNVIRARLQRQYPRLKRRALNLKLVEELNRRD